MEENLICEGSRAGRQVQKSPHVPLGGHQLSNLSPPLSWGGELEGLEELDELEFFLRRKQLFSVLEEDSLVMSKAAETRFPGVVKHFPGSSLRGSSLRVAVAAKIKI
tara:strand:- start:113 stop:433 length:321 start_codon:yes stop_codon:yes gene_type:complete